MALSRVSQHGAFTFLQKDMVYSDSLIVFPLDAYAAFCALQSRPHEIWARFFGSSLEERLRYTPSDVFETFPFPNDWTADRSLEAAGHAYYDFRADLMVERDEGLTKTYNRFHDPHDTDPAIVRLRELHADMDRAVLAAYGWSDLSGGCEFLEDSGVDTETPSSRRKKRCRYRWPDWIHNEVLARLLELSARRAGEQARSGTRPTTVPRSGGGANV